MPVLEWRETARADLLNVLDYISDDDPEAAQRLKDEIESVAAMLLTNPKLGRPGRVAGTREKVVRPNYLLVYAENTATVAILRVLHAARQWPQTEP